MIKSFKEFQLNENWADLFKDDRSEEQIFYDDIKSCLIHIIMDEQYISEKDFSTIDKLMLKMKELMFPSSDFFRKLNEMMSDLKAAKKCRPQYWAERAYQEILLRNFENMKENQK